MAAWPPSLVNQSVHPENCRSNCFWDKNTKKCLIRGLRREGYIIISSIFVTLFFSLSHIELSNLF